MVPPPVISWCPNGMPGGTNFGSGMTMGSAKKLDDPAVGMAGMSHGHSRRQAPAGGLSGLLSSIGSSMSSALSSFIPKFSIFVGQGDEGSPMNFYSKTSPIKTGFFIGKADTFNMMAEVVNYEKKNVEIYITIEYEYIPNIPMRTKEWLEVGMGAINVSPCASANLRKYELLLALCLLIKESQAHLPIERSNTRPHHGLSWPRDICLTSSRICMMEGSILLSL
jgi:hypothetical protein